mmetsp:Transcript_7085/g.9261  ORF Transcript_7085/g.9261 Transcript_7085/m.9261 type:complete len:457 (+) Transcript_7085:143-1513(+)
MEVDKENSSHYRRRSDSPMSEDGTGSKAVSIAEENDGKSDKGPKGKAEKMLEDLKKKKKLDISSLSQATRSNLFSLDEADQVEVLSSFMNGPVVRHPDRFIDSTCRKLRQSKSYSRKDLPDPVLKKLEDLIVTHDIDSKDFDRRYLGTFIAIDNEGFQLEILEEYLKEDKKSIKNPTHFLGGIVKRYYKESHSGLSKDTLDLLEEGYKSNPHLNKGDLEDKCIKALGKYPERIASKMVRSFVQSDLSGAKNMTAFFFGVMSRIDKENNQDRSERHNYGEGGRTSRERSRRGQDRFPRRRSRSRSAGRERDRRRDSDRRDSDRRDSGGVSKKIMDLFEEGYRTNSDLNRGDLSEVCIEALAKFPEHLAVKMVKSFIYSDLSVAKNLSAFFFGVVSRIDKQYKQDLRDRDSFRKQRDRHPRRRRSRSSSRNRSFGRRSNRRRSRSRSNGRRNTQSRRY